MGDSRPMSSGQPIPTPRFRVVSSGDDRIPSPYNNNQRPPPPPRQPLNNHIRPPNDGGGYLYQQHQQHDNFHQRPPHPPPRMQYQQQIRQGFPSMQRMQQQYPQQMNINHQRMSSTASPSMMMMPPPQHPQQPMQQQQQPQAQQQIPQHQQPKMPDQEQTENANKDKLIKVLKGFIAFCKKKNGINTPTLLNLIEKYIRNEINVMDFLQKYAQIVGANPQNNLQPFLESNIGLLRADIESGKITFDGLFRPPRLSTADSVSSPQSMHGGTSTSSPQSQSHPGPSPGPRPTSSGPSPMMQRILNEQPGSDPHPRMSSLNYSPLNNPPASAPSAFEASHKNSISDSTGSSSPYMFNQPSSASATATMSFQPLPSTSNYQQQQQSGGYGTTPDPAKTAKIIKTELMDTSESTPPETKFDIKSMPMEVDQKPTPPPIATATTSAPTVQPDVAFKEISSEQGDVEISIFDRKAFAARIQQKMPECSAFEEEVLTMLSSHIEMKIRSVLQQTAEAAEHRLEQLRVNPAFSLKDDPKAQLRILERQEKFHQQRRAEAEKETLLKMSKTKTSKDADMMEKAKKIKKADEDAVLNREANEAAIAALGTKKRKWQAARDGNNPSSSQASNSRPRAKQITMRDLMFVFEREPFAQNSLIYRKMLYGLIPNGNENNNATKKQTNQQDDQTDTNP